MTLTNSNQPSHQRRPGELHINLWWQVPGGVVPVLNLNRRKAQLEVHRPSWQLSWFQVLQQTLIHDAWSIFFSLSGPCRARPWAWPLSSVARQWRPSATEEAELNAFPSGGCVLSSRIPHLRRQPRSRRPSPYTSRPPLFTTKVATVLLNPAPPPQKKVKLGLDLNLTLLVRRWSAQGVSRPAPRHWLHSVAWVTQEAGREKVRLEGKMLLKAPWH